MEYCFFFEQFKGYIQQNYKPLFQGSNERSRLDRYGWYNALVAVASGDLEKMKGIEQQPIYSVLQLLTYMTEQAEDYKNKMKTKTK